jgi:predicted Zn-dependent protease
MAFDVLKRFVTPIPSFYPKFAPRLAQVMFAIVTLLVFIASLVPFQAAAQANLSFIRDAEIESTIRSFAAPLFRAAGMDAKDISILLVKDKTLNAFVAGGRNIFLHTGLIIESSGPDALIGVIAHETGHIEGGHLSRTRQAMEDASTIQMIGTLLGTIAAVGSGQPGAASAVMMGTQSAAQRTFMAYSRTQESAADQAAMRLLDATGRTGKGLEDFLSVLVNQEVLTKRLQDPYVQSHPISRTRVATLHNFNTSSPNADNSATEAEKLAHARIVAKLFGFIEPLNKVLKRYPESDQSFADKYARAIVYYRQPDLKRALQLVAELMVEHPNDPYLFELKGQMLFENGHLIEALKDYQEASRLAPEQDLILTELARVELELDDPALLDSAIQHFRKAIHLGGASSFLWRQLGVAYGRKGEMGLSSLALAEAELKIGQVANAEFLANRALKQLEPGTSAHIQAQDILQSIIASKEAGAAKK